MVLLCGSIRFPLWFSLLVMAGIAVVAFSAYSGFKALGLLLCGWRPRRTFMRDAAVLTVASVSGGMGGILVIVPLLRILPPPFAADIDGSNAPLYLFGIIAALIDGLLLRRWARWRAVQPLELDAAGLLAVGTRPSATARPWICAFVINAAAVALMAVGALIFA